MLGICFETVFKYKEVNQYQFHEYCEQMRSITFLPVEPHGAAFLIFRELKPAYYSVNIHPPISLYRDNMFLILGCAHPVKITDPVALLITNDCHKQISIFVNKI